MPKYRSQPPFPGFDPAAPGGNQPVLGWREWVALPEFSIAGIKAKIDTGARSSALHTHHYELFDRHGQPWVRFVVHPLRRTIRFERECETPVLEFRTVKDSGGHMETRPFIETTAVLGACRWVVRLSLTNRESMLFRMLLGRSALTGLFLVDPAQSYLLGNRPTRSRGF
ncbi:MAG TPA: RimK/LysX family protein [Verrucomicrobiales bacterium]|nr:RimK/LysX family protein [Verrucomicrobiales bacterium]